MLLENCKNTVTWLPNYNFGFNNKKGTFITKDHLQGRADRFFKNGTLLNKANRDKDSLRLNIDKI